MGIVLIDMFGVTAGLSRFARRFPRRSKKGKKGDEKRKKKKKHGDIYEVTPKYNENGFLKQGEGR